MSCELVWGKQKRRATQFVLANKNRGANGEQTWFEKRAANVAIQGNVSVHVRVAAHNLWV